MRSLNQQTLSYSISTLSVLCAAIVIAYIVPEVQSAEPQFQILPKPIIVTPDYAARFVVVETRGDETTVDHTRSANKELVLSGHAQANVGSDGLITINSVPINSVPINSAPINSAPKFEAAENPSPSNPIRLGVIRVRVGEHTLEAPIYLGDSQQREPEFPREVAAVLGKSGCNLGTCHGNLHGKGGFGLSLRGDDPQFDYTAITRGDGTRRIDSLVASESLLLKKPTGQIAHKGGVRFDTKSPEYQLLKKWIEGGCQWQSSEVPAPPVDPQSNQIVKSLEVSPNNCLMASECRQQQLVVIANFEDGSKRDVTTWARYEASSATGVQISRDGLVSVEGPIDFSVSVSYLNGRSAARLTFLPTDQPVWQEPVTKNSIDLFVNRQLRRMKLPANQGADDSTLLRRTYLTVVGRLPTATEAREYLADSDTDKHQRLIERLLNDPGYASLWSMRWSDLLRNEQKVMSLRGANLWHRWMTSEISNDRPLTGFVRDLVTSIGSTYENPPASFHRTHRDPETAAETVGQVFLGVRLQCARCHNHPFDRWRQDDYYGIAAHFTNIERKQIGNEPKDKFDKHIISGDEVISLTDRKSQIWHPGRATNVSPKALGDSYNSQSITEQSSQPLEAAANWLTTDNRMFARNMANRVFYHYMGRGIVDPPDDFRDSNPPSNPELLEYLTDELIRSDYSVKHLSRQILSSETFARAACSDVDHVSGIDAEAMFAGYPLRRAAAEVLIDAVCDVTGIYDEPNDDKANDEESKSTYRYVDRVDVPVRSGFLTTFGKPGRLLVCECERSSGVSLGQSLILVNGREVREKLESSKSRLVSLLKSTEKDLGTKIDELYLTALTREPSVIERQTMIQYVEAASEQQEAMQDVLWALINSKEFSLIR